MTRLDICRGATAVMLMVAASLVAPAHAQEPTMVLSVGKPLAFDFSGSPDGGVPAGTFSNFAFVLDLKRAEQKLIVTRDQPSKDVIATYDYADCSKHQEKLLERTIGGLGTGTPTFVDYVDIEMIPLNQTDLNWRGGVCYGFRTAGMWRWNLTATPLIYDAATQMLHTRLWVKEPNVDALKLVFDYSIPTQMVRAVKVTTQDLKSEIVQ
jgi:hypothetical protein